MDLKTIINLVAIGLLVLFAIRGWSRGLIPALTGFAGLVLGFYLGAHFAPVSGDLLGVDTTTGAYYGVAFLIIFILVNVGAYYLGSFLSEMISATPLGWVDNLGGALFGAFKWVLLLAVISLPLALLPVPASITTAYREAPAVSVGLTVGDALYRAAEPLVSEDMERFVNNARSVVGRQLDRARSAGENYMRDEARNRIQEYGEELSQ